MLRKEYTDYHQLYITLQSAIINVNSKVGFDSLTYEPLDTTYTSLNSLGNSTDSVD